MKKMIIAAGLVTAFAVASQAAVVEYWDFEDGSLQSGTAGAFTPAGEVNGSGYSAGVNGTQMHGWNSTGGLQFQDSTLGNGVGGNLEAYSDHMDGYIYDADPTSTPMMSWSSASWTVQMHLRIDDMDGWETVMAKMGSSYGVNESDFYLQRRGDQGADGVMRLNYQNAAGRTVLDGTTALQAGVWYGIAVVADDVNDTLSLYLDSGNGYVLDGQLTGQTQDLSVTASTDDWAFFRDYFNGPVGDNTTGAMDNLQIDDTALDITDLRVVPEPATIGMFAFAGAIAVFIRRRFRML